jgi:glycine/D-amino acid oxidase-like deaminating enzyme
MTVLPPESPRGPDADVTAPDGAGASSGAPAASPLPRRDFLRVAGLGAGALLAGASATACAPAATAFTPATGVLPPRQSRGEGHVVIIGAGAWGGWTALHLRRRGARVTLVDAYGPANSRATSGDETRGIRSSYGDRTTGVHWSAWARTAIQRWKEFDAQHAAEFGTKFYHETGDVILRATEDTFIKRTREIWTAAGVRHEVLTGDEVRKRWPVIQAEDITIAITEPDAGVARSRHATQAVAAIAQREGVRLVIARARPGAIVNGEMDGVLLDDGTILRGDAYVFCCGPWLRKLFPSLLEERMRVPLGTACYFAVPPGDHRFTFPNLPSFNFPGVTGWPALPVDSRGFRVRGGVAAAQPAGQAPAAAPAAPAAAGPRAAAPPRPPQPPTDPAQQDPDTSDRWAPQERIEGSRRFLRQRFPLLADMPLLETRTCHYESSINRDFIIDRLPACRNAWIAGVGQAEGFKFGPVVGEYVAQRVLGHEGDPTIAEMFKLPTAKYEVPPGGDDA